MEDNTVATTQQEGLQSQDAGVDVDTQTTPGADVDTTTAPTTAETSQQPTTPPSELEIEGVGKVTAADIKEWKMGYMRQSDYTRKTQEAAKQRKEADEALELYNYLRSNPNVAQALQSGNTDVISKDPVLNKLNPANAKVEDIEYKLAALELDNNLNRLKSQYNDFDEVVVLTEAEKRGISDLEFVYKALKADSIPDIANIQEKIAKEVRAQITREMQANTDNTQTIINNTDSSAQIDHGLTQEERLIADKMGISYEEYAKGKG